MIEETDTRDFRSEKNCFITNVWQSRKPGRARQMPPRYDVHSRLYELHISSRKCQNMSGDISEMMHGDDKDTEEIIHSTRTIYTSSITMSSHYNHHIKTRFGLVQVAALIDTKNDLTVFYSNKRTS